MIELIRIFGFGFFCFIIGLAFGIDQKYKK